ncbi:hypothetical protein L211DRAFT_842912 [Terfezia boudieri ATCC MYA-4762]|uniref:Hydrophobin n=1 Tax=Terfezia boudieri ATCC MYA-4762 TaxID=1051890 RepID=A0A3N4LBT5_9PEZI|nr:hypothetical protein L211DRAFT_842912 [Terfezia boudieri ATCC MYA-4762]
MQYSMLFTAATFFVLTWASPVDIVPRTASSCAPTQEASCCEEVQTFDYEANKVCTSILSIPITIGINCVGVTICNTDQQQYCCTQKRSNKNGKYNCY